MLRPVHVLAVRGLLGDPVQESHGVRARQFCNSHLGSG